NTNEQIGVCGGVLISPNAILTAGHCTVDAAQMGAATGQVDLNKNKLVPAVNLYSPKNWDATLATAWDLTKVPGDVAVVEMDQKFSSYSKLGTADLGCGYEIAGYGTTYSELTSGSGIDLSSGNRAKESIEVCIVDAIEGVLLLQPESGTGLCYGDSGSPVYIKGTDTVVGVLSAVMQNENGDFCDLNNYAVAVDIAYQKDFLSNFASTSGLQPGKIGKESFDAQNETLTRNYTYPEQNYNQYSESNNDFADNYNSDYNDLPQYTPDTTSEAPAAADNTQTAEDIVAANSGTIIIVVVVLLLCCVGLVVLLVVLALFKKGKKGQSPATAVPARPQMVTPPTNAGN
ncbi:trypsin-like serine protease, partial [Candidatus Dojkabacteria bacterium]|nr:trypsin-like serine protease [Candidatus Dojkabacteria bacterium]